MTENKDYAVETSKYSECLFDIKMRISIIAAHINKKMPEEYLITEVETICLQFRKILETIALLSLIANKDLYAEQNEKFHKHYHAKRIVNDLKRINPDFYPVPVLLIKGDDGIDNLVESEENCLSENELISIYEKCGGMMHAQNPFSTNKTKKDLEELRKNFPVWLTKIYKLLNHHKISLVGGKLMLVALIETKQTGKPQTVIFERKE